jgi:tetratricopeptide (TPR) repeat protein
VLVQAKKNDQAIQMLEKARASGSLSEENYVTLSKLYLITAQSSDTPKPDAMKAAAVLQDGMSKGVVKANADNYMLIGEANEMADNPKAAEDAYSKANATATDGEAAMRGGHLLLIDGKYSQARSLIQQAIQKGVKHKGTAYMLLAESERGLKNKPAAIAAMKKAEQQPETAAKARAWLKKAGA